MNLIRKFSTALEVWRKAGTAGIRRRIAWKRAAAAQERAYRKWLEEHGTPNNAELERFQREIEEFSIRPLISILLPVFNVEEKWLRSCIDSVFQQIYPHWELCIADDCSPSPHIRAVLDQYAASDPRMKVCYRTSNGHISAASNSALEISTGEFAVLLDHDDQLSPDALFWVSKELNDHPDTAMIYSDEDMVDENGRRYRPNFKPDFSYDLLLSLNLATHLSAYKTELLRSIGGFRVGLEGSQDYDLALRAIERIPSDQIRHIPKILYHWRAIPGSLALDSQEKPYAHERAREAIRGHLGRSHIKGVVKPTPRNLHRVVYELADPPPKVSVIIDQSTLDALTSEISAKTAYSPFEIVLVSDRQRADFECRDAKVLLCSDSKRAARLNFAVENSSGEICVFLDGQAIPKSDTWLQELVRFFVISKIGAVGGRIVAADDTVENGGLIIGTSDGVAPAFVGVPVEFPGMTARNDVISNFSAVSECCLAVRREDFYREGGFDESNLPNALFAADLCLRLQCRGLRVVLTPYADMLRKRNIAPSKPIEAELNYFKTRWPRQTVADPFYNSNLSRQDGTFAIKI